MSAFETDPLGWTEEWDETYQCYFFFHSATGESSWERPPGMPESEEAKELNISKDDNTGTASAQEGAPTTSLITDEIAEEASHWKVNWDENYEAEFYYNIVTMETVWEKPSCLLNLQSSQEASEGGTKVVDESAALDPANWTVEWDSSYGCDFFFNKITEESSWERPACLQVEVEGDAVKEGTKAEEEVEKVSKQLSNTALQSSPIARSGPGRRNSVMRRPSARPEVTTLKRVSVLEHTLTMRTPSALSSAANALPAKSKRRQSLAPRPAALPPKPLFIQEEFKSQMSNLFQNVPKGEDSREKEEQTHHSSEPLSKSNSIVLEGDDEEEEEEDSAEEGSKALSPSEGPNNLSSAQSTRRLDLSLGSGLETKRVKPLAIGTYLMKKSPALMKGWQKRYVVLKEGWLKYYGQKGDYDADKAPKGEVNLQQVSSEADSQAMYITGSANTEIHLHIRGDENVEDKKSKAAKDRLLVLQAIDETSAAEWLEALRNWVKYVNY